MAIAIGLLKTLLELAEARKTGALDAQGPSARVRLFVENGHVVAAEEGGVGETLGRILLRENVLNDEQYASAIEWMTDAVTHGRSVRLGEVLLQKKLITREQLTAALSAQVRQKVVRALGWTTAQTSFIECKGALDIEGRYQTTLEPLVLAALRTADPAGIDELFAQSRTRFVSLRGDRTAGGGTARMRTIARLTSFQMPKNEDAIARALDGSRTVAEIMLADGGVVLAALLLTDCLDLHSYAQAPRLERRKSSGNAMKAVVPPKLPSMRPAARKLPSKRPPSSLFGFEALEAPTLPRVSQKPPSRTLTGSYRAVSMRPPAEDKRKAQQVTTKLKAAREARRALPPPLPEALAQTPATPMAPLAPMARLLAEKAFQAGKKHLRANAMANAADEMRRASQLYAAPEYQLWAAWATLRADANNEMQHATSLQEAAERALDDDAELGFGWYALGWIAKKNGEHTRAAELFERARVLDPEAVELAHDIRLKLATPQAFVTPSRSLTGLPAVSPPPRISTAPPPPAFATAQNTAETRGELRALAPPMSTPISPPVAPGPPSEAAPQTPRVMPAPPPIGALGEQGRIPPAAPSTPREMVPDPASTPRMVAAEPPPPPLVPPPPPSSRRGPPPLPPSSSHLAAAAPVSSPGPPSSGLIAAPPSSSRLLVAEPPPSSERSFAPADAPRRASSSGVGAMIGAAVVMVVAIGAGVMWLRRPAPRTDVPIVDHPPMATATSAPVAIASSELAQSTDAASAPDVSEVTMIDAAPPASVSAQNTADAGAEAAAPIGNDVVPAGQGALDFPNGAAGHRVFVDGRVVGEPPAPILVTCGVHQIKVGSRGVERAIAVPCGTRVSVPYP